MKRSTVTAAAVLCALLLAGCAGGGSKRSAAASQPGKLSVNDLDQITLVYADRYMTLVSSACDQIAKDNPSSQQRLTAMQVKLINCSSLYDIATSPDAFARLLDMTLVVTLQGQVWIDDGRADRLFGDRGPLLEKALRQARRDIWKIAAQVLTPDQLEGFDRLILRWRRDNPDVEFVSYVRFNDVATSRAKAIAETVRRGGGFLAPINEAKQSVDAVRLFSERMFYFLKRFPFLMDWQGQVFVEETLQKPQVQALVNRVDKLPQDISAQREALFKDLDARHPQLTELMDGVNAALKTTDQTLQHMTQTSESLRQTMAQYDAIVARYEAMPASTQPSRPFDVTEYGKAAQDLDRTARSLNELIKSSDALVASPQWSQRVNEVDSMAQARIRQAITESKGMVGFTTTQMVFLCAIFFAFMTTYSLLSRWIGKKFFGAKAGRE